MKTNILHIAPAFQESGGGIFGALPGGAGLITGVKVTVGLGIAGAAIGAFFAGIGAVGEGADVIGIDGSGFKTLSTNIASGLVSFNEIERKRNLMIQFQILQFT